MLCRLRANIPSGRFGPGFVAMAAALLLPSFAWAAGEAWEAGSAPVGFHGAVLGAVATDHGLYVGGSYDAHSSNYPGFVARWDGTRWEELGNTLFRSPVDEVAEHAGVVYAAGTFSAIGDYPTGLIAKWNGSTWEPVGESGLVGSRAAALASFAGELYAGGLFSKADGMPVANLAAWDGTSWSDVGGANREVRDLLVWQNRLCAAGDFDRIGGIDAAGVACWDGSEWSALGSGVSGAIVLAGHDGFLYAGGTFLFAGGVETGAVARWNGSTWESIGFPLTDNPRVVSLAFRGDTLVVGMGSGSDDEDARPWVIEWDGEDWTNAAVQPNGGVSVLLTYGEGVFAGGDFLRAGNVVLGGEGVWDGTEWKALAEPGSHGLHGSARAFAVWKGDLVVGGDFLAAGDSTATLLARWDGTSWQPVGNTSPTESVSFYPEAIHALLASGDDLYAGGRFTSLGGTDVVGVARWDGGTWSPLGDGVDGVVHALHMLNGKLYVAGEFQHAGGIAARNIAVWDGAEWSPLGGGTNMAVRTLCEFDGKLVAGGDFDLADGSVEVDHVARWDGKAWQAMDEGLDRDVLSLLVHEGVLFAGGRFTHSGALHRLGIAKWNGSSWASLGGGIHEDFTIGSVSALASLEGELVMGGRFQTAGGRTARNIVRWNASTGTWSPLPPGTGPTWVNHVNPVVAIASHEGTLWVGGAFRELADGRDASGFARWTGCILGNQEACSGSTTTTISTSTVTTSVTLPPSTLPSSSTTSTSTPFVPECGDTSWDGWITAVDALITLHASVGSAQCELWVCDTNDDQAVTAADALAILKIAVGQMVVLGCPPR